MACDFHIIGVLIFVSLCPWGMGWGLLENRARLILEIGSHGRALGD